MNEVDHIAALKTAWTGALRADRSSGFAPRSYIYASGIRTCTRAMALDVLHPEDQEPFNDEALARMKRGDEREHAIVAWLYQIGPRSSPPFKVVEGQRRFEIKDRDGTVIVVGKVDCRLDFGGGVKPFVEVKSGEAVRNIDDFHGFDRSPWTRHYPDQLLAYLYAENTPWGLFILDRPGLPQFIKVDLMENLERVERALGQCRRALDVKLNDAPLPPFIEDPSECRRCPHWKKSCTPPIDFGAGVQHITDPVLIECAAIREKSRAAHEDYEGADKRLKEALRGVETAILGDYIATGKWSRHTTYEIPAEVKEPYKVVKEQGKFTLTIERI